MILPATALTEGEATGQALVLAEPISFWGGIDSASGAIIDSSHPDLGRSVAGRVLVMESGRGSSSSSSVLAEALRRGTGPVGIVLERPDPILVVGALVARVLYGIRCPIVICQAGHIENGTNIRITARGTSGQVEIASGSD